MHVISTDTYARTFVGVLGESTRVFNEVQIEVVVVVAAGGKGMAHRRYTRANTHTHTHTPLRSSRGNPDDNFLCKSWELGEGWGFCTNVMSFSRREPRYNEVGNAGEYED